MRSCRVRRFVHWTRPAALLSFESALEQLADRVRARRNFWLTATPVFERSKDWPKAQLDRGIRALSGIAHDNLAASMQRDCRVEQLGGIKTLNPAQLFWICGSSTLWKWSQLCSGGSSCSFRRVSESSRERYVRSSPSHQESQRWSGQSRACSNNFRRVSVSSLERRKRISRSVGLPWPIMMRAFPSASGSSEISSRTMYR